MIGIDEVLKRIDYLPPFPRTVTKALKLLRDPKVSPDSIAEVIKFDQALSGNIIRLCNSSYFGLSSRVTNLKQAIVYIGLVELKRLIIISGTRQYFENRKPGYEVEKGELWRHVLAVSIIGEKLGVILDVGDNDELFLATLLHDVGKLVMSDYVLEAYQQIMQVVEQRGLSFLEAEKEIVGHDHAEVGGMILDMWDFPEEVVRAVRDHHQPPEPDDSVLDNIVRLSDTLAIVMGYETSIDGLAYPGFSEICRQYGIKQHDIDRIMAESLEDLNKIESDFGFPLEE